jgi:hypothetical protein
LKFLFVTATRCDIHGSDTDFEGFEEDDMHALSKLN